MRIDLREAERLLNAGTVVAVPTETVYGLAARLGDAKAVALIFSLKGRPQDNPLIVHVTDETQLFPLVARFPSGFKELKGLWPGPLTLILPANPDAVPDAVRAGLPTVAVRVPRHPLVRELIARVGPLVAPSANLSGRPSATSPPHVEADFGAEFPVLDGGESAAGVESSIVALHDDGWEILRTGAIAAEELELAMGVPPLPGAISDKPRAPGQKYRHYAPRACLTVFQSREGLGAAASVSGPVAVLGFDDTPHGNLPLISLGGRGDFVENLKRLYGALRSLDEQGRENALVDLDFPCLGLGVTLADRLRKAANRVCVKGG